MDARFVAEVERDEDHDSEENVGAVDNRVDHVENSVVQTVAFVAVELFRTFLNRGLRGKANCEHCNYLKIINQDARIYGNL